MGQVSHSSAAIEQGLIFNICSARGATQAASLRIGLWNRISQLERSYIVAGLSISETQDATQQISGVVRAARAVYLVCAILLATGVIFQVFFAGATLLVNGSYLELHRTVAHIVELVSMMTVIVGLFTRLPWRVQALGGLFLLLMFAQYIFLYAMPALGVPSLRALHAVNALAMFWVALAMAQRTWAVAGSQ